MAPRGRHRNQRAQSLVEAALALPFIVTLVMGTFDLGRIAADQSIVTNEANAGIIEAVISQSSDVGTPIRAASSVLVGNTVAAWGYGYTGGTGGHDYDCTGANQCGDNNTGNPCASSSAWWQPGVLGCYSVGTCTLGGANDTTCTYTWGETSSTRPAAAAGAMIAVIVVVRFKPITPFVSSLESTGYVYVTKTVISRQTY